MHASRAASSNSRFEARPAAKVPMKASACLLGARPRGYKDGEKSFFSRMMKIVKSDEQRVRESKVCTPRTVPYMFYMLVLLTRRTIDEQDTIWLLLGAVWLKAIVKADGRAAAFRCLEEPRWPHLGSIPTQV